MKTIAILLLLPVLATAAHAQDGPEKKAPDIMTVTPEELGGVDARALTATAHAAYQEKRYEDAARAFIEALRASPGDSGSLYNLACCFGLIGAEKQAARFLEAAYKAGFRDLGHIRSDPDFESVRESEEFQEAFARLEGYAEKLAREKGTSIPVVAEVMADVRVIAPENMDPFKRYPLVIGLHGFGDNADNFAALFSRREIDAPFLYCVAQAPYAFGSGTNLGYSWTLRDSSRADGMRSHDLSSRYVLAVIEAVKKQFPVDERNVFLMGFSQGAGMAFSIGMHHPDLFRGVIPVGGWLDPGEFTAAEARSAKKHGLFLVCHSPEDRMVPFDGATNAVAFLTEEGIPHRLVRYEGGHSLPKALMEKIAAWIADPRPEIRLIPLEPAKAIETKEK